MPTRTRSRSWIRTPRAGGSCRRVGSWDRIRTCDLAIMSRLLYHLATQPRRRIVAELGAGPEQGGEPAVERRRVARVGAEADRGRARRVRSRGRGAGLEGERELTLAAEPVGPTHELDEAAVLHPSEIVLQVAHAVPESRVPIAQHVGPVRRRGGRTNLAAEGDHEPARDEQAGDRREAAAGQRHRERGRVDPGTTASRRRGRLVRACSVAGASHSAEGSYASTHVSTASTKGPL